MTGPGRRKRPDARTEPIRKRIEREARDKFPGADEYHARFYQGEYFVEIFKNGIGRIYWPERDAA